MVPADGFYQRLLQLVSMRLISASIRQKKSIIDLLVNSICGYKNGSVITMQPKRTFIAAISVIMLRLTIFLEIMKALNGEMTI